VDVTPSPAIAKASPAKKTSSTKIAAANTPQKQVEEEKVPSEFKSPLKRPPKGTPLKNKWTKADALKYMRDRVVDDGGVPASRSSLPKKDEFSIASWKVRARLDEYAKFAKQGTYEHELMIETYCKAEQAQILFDMGLKAKTADRKTIMRMYSCTDFLKNFCVETIHYLDQKLNTGFKRFECK
jgi:hypothetical protein